MCLDLEGVLVPEVWIHVAEHTGIDALRLTTRDVADYDALMRGRLRILEEHGLGLRHIQDAIDTMAPLPGAVAFLDALRERYQVVLVSDTFYEFAAPLVRKLGRPTLFCHRLEVGADDRITGYRLRQTDPKRRTVEALRALQYKVIAAGDSYNDTSMLAAADAGILFRAPEHVVREFPQFPHVREYDELTRIIDQAAGTP